MANTIPIQNIYYMLSYAFKELKQAQYAEVGREQFEHVYDLLAAILIIRIKPLMTQGLYRTYVTNHETLASVRGKIDINASIAVMQQRRRALVCEFDEFAADNLYNQILKSTLWILLRQKSVKLAQKAEVKQLFNHFGDVSIIDVTRINWRQLTYHQRNRRYQLLMQICRFIIDGTLMNTAQAQYTLASFFDEQRISRLYESFVREFVRYHYPHIAVTTPQIDWQVSDGDTHQLPRMQSDIVLTHAGRALIIDTKYYAQSMQQQYQTYKLHSSHLYQMFTYLKNYDARNLTALSGLILYAKTDAAVTPDTTVNVSGHRLSVTSLDLNADFAHITCQIDTVVRDGLGGGYM